MTVNTEDLVPDARYYVEATTRAEETYNAADKEVRQKETGSNYREIYTEREKLRQTYMTACQQAWDAHVASSEHPLINWMVKNVSDDYRSQVTTILQHLTPTTTIGDLDEIARVNDWCYTWNEFRSCALRDGALVIEYAIEMRVNGGPPGRTSGSTAPTRGGSPRPC